MATYAIGDIQGCYKTLRRLLDRISFHRKSDRIFLVGDLVNRGPDSLDVLRWAVELGDRVISVLGNHDLHLLAIAAGVSVGRRQKTLDKVLRAKDCDVLLEWLRNRPLLYREGRLAVVHAGILPAWSVDVAAKHARKVEKIIRGKKFADLMRYCYKEPAFVWNDGLEGLERHAVVLNAFTRMRLCRSLYEMDLNFAGTPEEGPRGEKPWFQVGGRKAEDHTIIFGHWASMGLHVTQNVIALDSGCVWGGSLTAMRLEDGGIFSEPSVEK